MPSLRRRSLLAALGATTASLAGCSSTPEPDDPPQAETADAIDADNHVYGATGEWASVGCNASNTRSVDDGQAPVDGLTERWRVEVAQLGSRSEPIVADDRVYVREPTDSLRVLDAADGSELWTHDARTAPLVRDLVYVGSSDGLLALDPSDGTTQWSAPVGTVTGPPATYAGDWLYVPVGETLYRIDARSGEVDWSRRLFGRIVGPVAVYSGYGVVAVTEAGQLAMLSSDGGSGQGYWSLPARPQTHPTVDTDGIYVNCLDGTTYGVELENAPRYTIAWDVETGWANGGLAVSSGVYAAGTRGLFAIDPESGEERWHHGTGDWRHTAPALGRDTLFVGGDRLYALDPTPGDSLDGGPAVRFEREFHGRVGPGPVLDDGSLYVVAQTGSEAFHLLAFD